MNRARDPQFVHAVVIATIPASALALLFGAMEPVMLPRWWMALVAAGLGGAALLIGTFRQRLHSLPSAWYLGAVVVFAVGMIASVMTAEEGLRALMGTYSRWTGASGYLAYAVLGLLAAATAYDTRRIQRLGSVILGTAGFVAAYALVQRVGLDPLPWDNVYAPSAPSMLGNPNFAAAFMGIPVPLVAARMLTVQSRRTRLAYGVLIVLLIAGQAATRSWLGPFAMTVGLVSMAAAVMLASSRRTHRWSGVALGLGLPAAGIAVVWALWTGVVTAGGTVEIRIYYWRAALEMFADHPLLGVGLARFQDFFRRYRPVADYRQLAESAFTDNPHSVPLTLASEGGLILVVPWTLLVLVVIALVVSWAREAHRDPIPRHERLTVAAWSGAFVGYVAQSLASLDVPSIAVLGFVLAGSVAAMTSGVDRRPFSLPPAVQRGATLAASAGAIALIVAAGVPVSADLAAGQGLDHESAGDFAQAAQLFDQAASRAWWEPRYRFAAAQMAYSMGDLESAQERFEATARTFPQLFQPALSSARIAVELGQHERAADWYRRALVLEPNDPELATEANAIIDPDGDVP